MFKVNSVRPIRNGGNLVAEVNCSYDELAINQIPIFQNGKKGLEVSWPKQRPNPKSNYSKWTPIVVPSEKLKREAEPIILKAVKDKLGEGPL